MGTGSIWPLISAGPSEKRGFSSEFNDAGAECINGPAIH